MALKNILLPSQEDYRDISLVVTDTAFFFSPSHLDLMSVQLSTVNRGFAKSKLYPEQADAGQLVLF